MDYRYNIRGWLTSINDVEADGQGPKDLFSMNLYYDWGFTVNAFNGNIAGTKWKSANNPEISAYGYRYDNANRITGADYVAGIKSAPEVGISWNITQDRFDVGNISYDLNGNIKGLQRNGLVQQEGAVKVYNKMDRLVYDYSGMGNQLRNVQEDEDSGASNSFRFKQKAGANVASAQEYFYDANGNMNKDLNKGISNIGYNHLNLPKEVIKDNGSKIIYTYDAAGIKLRQQVFEGTATTPAKVVDYIGGLVYENDKLQFMQHPEGRVLFHAATGDEEPEYQYHLKDHLGNVRLTFTSKPKTDVYLATMETERAAEEESEFLNLDRKPVAWAFDHTNRTGFPVGATPEAIRLNGGSSTPARKGPRKTLAVMAGDVIKARVWAKYLDLREKSTELSADMIMAALGGASGYTVTLEGSATRIVHGSTGYTALLSPLDDQSQPKAYLSWQFLPANDNPLHEDKGMVQVSSAAAISKASGTGSFELLEVTVTIKQAGWINVELDMAGEGSYDPETRNIDVYFDDFEVNHHHGLVVQEDSYYPFGLTFNSYQREGSLENNFQYNGKESQDDWGVIDYGARMYQPDLGRWFNPDPLADMMPAISPYAYCYNNPLIFTDPTGMLPKYNWDTGQYEDDDGNVITFEAALAAHQANAQSSSNGPKSNRQLNPEYIKYINFRADNNNYTIRENWVGPVTPFGRNLTDEFAGGYGPTNSLMLDDHPMTQALTDAWQVRVARQHFYLKYAKDILNGKLQEGASWTNHAGKFDAMGLFLAGTDITEQFVGSMTIDVFLSENKENLIFRVSNSTNMTSALYRQADEYERGSGRTPGGNTYQIYMWTEPINVNQVRELTQSTSQKILQAGGDPR